MAGLETRLAEAEAALATLDEAVGREPRSLMERDSAILRLILQDLVDRGEIDLEEGPIDASFSEAKKGALELVKRSAAKGARSWQLQTAMVFLSPCTWPALHRMKPSA